MVVRDRQQVIRHGEAAGRVVADGVEILDRRRGVRIRAAAETRAARALCLPLVAAVVAVVDAADVHEHLESELRLVAQRATDLEQGVLRDAIPELTHARRPALAPRTER